MKKLENIINEICEEKGLKLVNFNLNDPKKLKLREDIGMDSFDLAQLTVMIEDEYDVDVFEDGIVSNVGEIIQKIKQLF